MLHILWNELRNICCYCSIAWWFINRPISVDSALKAVRMLTVIPFLYFHSITSLARLISLHCVFLHSIWFPPVFHSKASQSRSLHLIIVFQFRWSTDWHFLVFLDNFDILLYHTWILVDLIGNFPLASDLVLRTWLYAFFSWLFHLQPFNLCL